MASIGNPINLSPNSQMVQNQEAPSLLQSLPLELWQRVLGHITDNQAKQQASLVNRAWKELVFRGAKDQFQRETQDFLTWIESQLPYQKDSIVKVKNEVLNPFNPEMPIAQFKKIKLLRNADLANLLRNLDEVAFVQLQSADEMVDTIGIFKLVDTFKNIGHEIAAAKLEMDLYLRNSTLKKHALALTHMGNIPQALEVANDLDDMRKYEVRFQAVKLFIDGGHLEKAVEVIDLGLDPYFSILAANKIGDRFLEKMEYGDLSEGASKLALLVFEHIGLQFASLKFIGNVGFKKAVEITRNLSNENLRNAIFNEIINEGADKSKFSQFRRLDAMVEKRMGDKIYARWEVNGCSRAIKLIIESIKYFFRFIIFSICGCHIEDADNSVFLKFLRMKKQIA